MYDLIEVPILDMFVVSKVLNVDMLETFLKVGEDVHTETARLGLLLDRYPRLLCKFTALLHRRDSMRLVQVVHHYVPSLT